MQKSDRVLFIDAKGVVHEALVAALNPFHPTHLSVVYVGDEGVVTAADVPHMTDPEKAEKNPELPNYTLNCWKLPEEKHVEIPADHPNFDPAFLRPAKDENGKVIPIQRPAYEAQVAAHLSVDSDEIDNGALPPALKTVTLHELSNRNKELIDRLDTIASERDAAVAGKEEAQKQVAERDGIISSKESYARGLESRIVDLTAERDAIAVNLREQFESVEKLSSEVESLKLDLAATVAERDAAVKQLTSAPSVETSTTSNGVGVTSGETGISGGIYRADVPEGTGLPRGVGSMYPTAAEGEPEVVQPSPEQSTTGNPTPEMQGGEAPKE